MILRKILLAAVIVSCFGLISVSAQKPVREISAGVVNGKAKSLPKPEYPAAAQAVGAGGAVNVQVTIDEQGSVISATVVSGHPLLREAAIKAARLAKFAPTQLSGNPVKVKGIIVYQFIPAAEDKSEMPEKTDTQSFIVDNSAKAENEPAAQKTGPVRSMSGKAIDGGIVNSGAISLPKPVYPAAARAVAASGAVNVQVKIDENGDVVSASAVSGHPLLRAASVAAARQAKFKPTLLEGNPVSVTGVIIYNFTSPIPQKPEPAENLNEEVSAASSKTISGGVLNGKAISLPKPAYPLEAREKNASGTVSVSIKIDEQGNVISANAVSGDPLLYEACEKAALEAKFTPTLLEGTRVKVTGTIVYNFIP